jgi:hypothetical protein
MVAIAVVPGKEENDQSIVVRMGGRQLLFAFRMCTQCFHTNGERIKFDLLPQMR